MKQPRPAAPVGVGASAHGEVSLCLPCFYSRPVRTLGAVYAGARAAFHDHVVALSAAIVEYHARPQSLPAVACPCGVGVWPTVTPSLHGALFEPLVAANCRLRRSDDMCLRLLLATALAAGATWVELKLSNVREEDLRLVALLQRR